MNTARQPNNPSAPQSDDTLALSNATLNSRTDVFNRDAWQLGQEIFQKIRFLAGKDYPQSTYDLVRDLDSHCALSGKLKSAIRSPSQNELHSLVDVLAGIKAKAEFDEAISPYNILREAVEDLNLAMEGFGSTRLGKIAHTCINAGQFISMVGKVVTVQPFELSLPGLVLAIDSAYDLNKIQSLPLAEEREAAKKFSLSYQRVAVAAANATRAYRLQEKYIRNPRIIDQDVPRGIEELTLLHRNQKDKSSHDLFNQTNRSFLMDMAALYELVILKEDHFDELPSRIIPNYLRAVEIYFESNPILSSTGTIDTLRKRVERCFDTKENTTSETTPSTKANAINAEHARSEIVGFIGLNTSEALQRVSAFLSANGLSEFVDRRRLLQRVLRNNDAFQAELRRRLPYLILEPNFREYIGELSQLLVKINDNQGKIPLQDKGKFSPSGSPGSFLPDKIFATASLLDDTLVSISGANNGTTTLEIRESALIADLDSAKLDGAAIFGVIKYGMSHHGRLFMGSHRVAYERAIKFAQNKMPEISRQRIENAFRELVNSRINAIQDKKGFALTSDLTAIKSPAVRAVVEHVRDYWASV